MSYAVRTDGSGWRAINSASDVDQNEYFSNDIPSPTPQQIADKAARDAQDQADKSAKQFTKGDQVTQYLVNHTPAECAAYVASNANNLGQAIQLLQKFAMIISVLARAQLR